MIKSPILEASNPPKITIYTDGSCLGNPGRGGYAAILIYGNKEKIITGGRSEATNNQMEMLAAIKALSALKRDCEIELFTDSTYLKDGITKWIHGWQKNNWKTAGKKPVKNKDLWLMLLAEIKKHKIDWRWVKGHANNEYNNRADELAHKAATMQKPKQDVLQCE